MESNFDHSKRRGESMRSKVPSSTIKDVVQIVAVVLLIIGIIGGCIWLVYDVQYASTHPTGKSTIQLSEMENGVYAYRQVVVSSIPAQNYDIAIFCDEHGRQYTVKGHVFTAAYSGQPYAVIERYRVINADRVTIYAPIQTIRYLDAVSVGRR